MNSAVNRLDLLYIPAAIAAAPWWARKARGDWPARFGHGEALPAPSDRPRVLVHAVSVGEVNALRTLVPILAERADLVVSVGTDTGIDRARHLFADRCPIVRYPVDLSSAVGRFLDRVRPDAVALVELELWPNFLRACARREIPACVINGRLSERSFRGYRRIRAFMRPLFGGLAFAGVQDEAYRDRFVAMGLDPARCVVTGSMKWDAAPTGPGTDAAEALAREMGIDRRRPLVVAGSTAEGEEALLHAACPPGAQLLCAPRQPQRFDEAARDLPGCARRSSGTPAPAGTSRYLLDTIGELAHAYALADVVVMGRTFGDLYGSDPIEPAALGKPVVVGPSVSDFASIVRALEEAGGLVRATREHLPADLRMLIDHPERCDEIGEAARACVEAQRGVSQRHAEMILDLAERSTTGARAATGTPDASGG